MHRDAHDARARIRPSARPPVRRAHERFDAHLRLTDQRTRALLADLLARFDQWIAREQAASSIPS